MKWLCVSALGAVYLVLVLILFQFGYYLGFILGALIEGGGPCDPQAAALLLTAPLYAQ